MAKVKVGLRAGGGAHPGYQWSVWYLEAARSDAMGFLTEEQYGHVVDLMRALASEPDPRRPKTVDVSPIEDYFELSDKGGILGKINLRVFFTIVEEGGAILALAAIKKEAEHKTPEWVKVRVRYRLRRFRLGEYGPLPT